MRELSGARVALFLPCYVDQLAPRVGFATLAVLRAIGIEAHFPRRQACCGQPLSNSGCAAEARPLAERTIDVFAGFDYVVCPSGSCTAMIRHGYAELVGAARAAELSNRSWELSEFLVEIAGVERWSGSFPARVGLHHGCHGLRDLRLAGCSERMESRRDLVAGLLSGIDGLELVDPRRDECCGFGGAFSVEEPEVSAMMGRDRLADHRQAGAEVVASTDMSCLLHLDGLARRDGGAAPRLMHVAEILAAAGAAR